MALFDKLKKVANDVVEKTNAFVEEQKLEEQLTGLTDDLQKAWTNVTAPKEDVADQIEKLAKLKESGALTEEEFNQKKAELLAKK